MIAYRWDSGDPVSIWARRYNADGTAIDVAFRVDRDSGAVISPEVRRMKKFEELDSETVGRN